MSALGLIVALQRFNSYKLCAIIHRICITILVNSVGVAVTNHIRALLFLLVALQAACNQSEGPQSSAARAASIAVSPLEELRAKADAGDIEALKKISLAYLRGSDGAPKDLKESFKWYSKAAEAGDVKSMAVVAEMYADGEGIQKDRGESLRWWKKAADAGHPHALMIRAQDFGKFKRDHFEISGSSLEEQRANLAQMLDYLGKASEKGSSRAKYYLGMAYLLGISSASTSLLAQDGTKATALLGEAASSDEWEARWALAILSQYGFGSIKADTENADKWWQLLESEKRPEIQRLIGNRYFANDKSAYKVGKNKWRSRLLTFQETNELAAEWYEKSSRQGDIAATARLAHMYRDGMGVPRNQQKAFALYKQNAAAGDPHSQRWVGLAYLDGDGVARDYSQALQWFLKVANNESASREDVSSAQSALAFLYSSAYGVERSHVLAYAWANLAAAGGREGAQKILLEIEKKMSSQEIREAQQLSSSWKPGVELIYSTDATGTSNTSDKDKKISKGAGGLILGVQGSSVLVSSEGHLLTNSHVVHQCKEIRIPALSKLATIVVQDAANDLAIVKADTILAAPVTVGDPDRVRQGDNLLTFGYPLDGYLPMTGNITPGLISALAGPGNNSSLIQITAPTQVGSSGGPVLNMKGELIGLVVGKADTIKIAKATGDVPQNINFAVSNRVVKGFLEGNGIPYSKPQLMVFAKSPPEIAESARRYTYKLECWR